MLITSRRIAIFGSIAMLAATLASPAQASFHEMQISRVMVGVNGDTNAQAIELRMRGPFENLLSVGSIQLIAYDAAGTNPVSLIEFNSDVAAGTGKSILVTTSDFNSLTSPTAVSDFTMTNRIPDSYLAAGRLTYESDIYGILWSIAWGGSAYTGSTTGSLINDDDGDFGKLNAGLSGADLLALQFNGSSTAASTTNTSDYALTSGSAVFTNNAGDSFLVPEPASAMILLALGGAALIRRRR